MHDFYGFIEWISTRQRIDLSITLMQALSRNMNGFTKEALGEKIKLFRSRLGVPLIPRNSALELISLNLSDSKSRHLMIITENNFAFSYLLDVEMINYHEVIIIFSTDYLDYLEDNICKLLNKVRYCMEHGLFMVMVGYNRIYELLSEMFSQV